MKEDIKNSLDFSFWTFLKYSFFIGLFIALFASILIIFYIDVNYDHVFNGKKDCAVVFGAAVWKDDIPSHALFDRTISAINLYKNNNVECLIFSGGNSRYGSHESDVMEKIAINEGVLAKDIFIDYEGNNTLRTLYNIKERFPSNSFVFVSNDFHLARINLIARKLKITEFSLHAAKYNNGRYIKNSYFFWREFLGVLYYGMFL